MLGNYLRIYLTLFVVLLVSIIVILCIIAVVNTNRIIAHTGQIINSYEDFISLYVRDRYFSERDLNRWIKKWIGINFVIRSYERYNASFKDIISKTGVLVSLILRYRDYFFVDDEYNKKLKYVSNVFKNGLDIIKERNEEYIENELIEYKDFFDSVVSKPLTVQQRKCIIVDEAHNLIVAGAGTGKTSTIVGKVGYLLKKGVVNPDEVLMMSFGRHARDEMTERIKSKLNAKVDVRTFHSLGYHVIGQATGVKPSITEIAEDRRVLLQRLNQKLEIFLEKRIEDYHFLDLVNRYFTYYLKPVENVINFKSEQEYEDYLKQCEIRTLQGEKVKSYEECIIANFLYLNGIKYEYEKDYIVDTATSERRQYQPDFFLTDYGIWIEHFGVDRDWNTAQDVDNQKYIDDIYRKRKIHLVYSTHLIETFNYERSEGILIENLKEKLTKAGVEFEPISRDEVFNKIKSLGDVNLFVGLVSKFLNLFKSSNAVIADLKIMAKKYLNWRRYHVFLDIFKALYDDYEYDLRESGRIDFNDMIIQATDIVNKKNYSLKCKYILVDEFQDISQSRYRFLKSLLDQNEGSKLFCVGDDWQSIYRFAGSDLGIMTNFSEYFDPIKIMFLDKTFRLNDKTNTFSSRFITKNPAQFKKDIKAKPVDFQAITIVWYDDLNDAMIETLRHIDTIEKNRAEVLILGRYNLNFYHELGHKSIDRLVNPQSTLNGISPSKLKVNYLTAHRSKGTEADYVIIIGLRAGAYGFPCEIEDDPVLKLVLSQEDMYPNAEERRLFYVGITRAKKRVFLLADGNITSSFIYEIIRNNYDVNVIGDEPARAAGDSPLF